MESQWLSFNAGLNSQADQRHPQLVRISSMNILSCSFCSFFLVLFAFLLLHTAPPRGLEPCAGNASAAAAGDGGPCFGPPRRPVRLVGGVAHPSAARRHQKTLFSFVWEESACLFIKGFDHQHAPGLQGPPSLPQRWSHPVHSVSRPELEHPLYYWRFLFHPLSLPVSPCSSISLLSHFMPNDGLILRLKPRPQ